MFFFMNVKLSNHFSIEKTTPLDKLTAIIINAIKTF